MGQTLVADLERGLRHIFSVIQHETSGFGEPQTFLALQWAHSHGVFEFLMKLGYTHISLLRQMFDGKGIAEVLFDPAVSLVDGIGLTDIYDTLNKLSATGTAENIINDFPHHVFPDKLGWNSLSCVRKETADRLDHMMVR